VPDPLLPLAEPGPVTAHRGSSAVPVVAELERPVVPRRALPFLAAALLAVVALMIWRARTYPIAPMLPASVAAPGPDAGPSAGLDTVPDGGVPGGSRRAD
jgi:hypothetical protein